MSILRLSLVLAIFISGAVSAAVTEISQIQSINCDLNQSYCLIHLEKPFYTAGNCSDNTVSISADSQQTLSVLSSAMYTQTPVKLYLSAECAFNSHMLQAFNLVK